MQTPTPPPPPTKRFVGRAMSVCSQRYPGSVKSGLSSAHCKSRCEDDDIPSDESDHGAKRPFGPNLRTRIRKRRALSVRTAPHQPMSSGMSWMSTTKCMKTESVFVPSSSCSNVTSGKNVKKALFPLPSNPNKSPTQVRPGPSGLHLHGAKSFTVHSNLGHQRGGTSMKSPPRASKELIKSGPSSNPDPVAHKASIAVDWVLYSIWHPAWDVIWKCDNGKRPLSQNQYFRKLITEVLAVNTTPSDVIAASDLKVIKVQGMKEDGHGKLNLIGALEVEARRPPNQRKKKYIKWNPTPDLLGRLLKYVVSVSDLIVQYKYPKTLGTGNAKGKLCFIHITPKDGQPVDCFELSKMGAQVSAYNINYDYYKPKVVKCVPFKLARTKKNAQEPVDVEATSPVTVADKAKATSKNLADYVFGSPGPSPISSPNSLSGSRPNALNITDDQQYQDQEPVDVGNAIEVAQALSPLSEQIEEMEISDGEEVDVSPNPIPSGRLNENSVDNDFNLTSFLTSGQFVPGPLRPKVKKPDKQNVYHTLEELAVKLNDSIAEDVAKGVVPNMLIKHQCNTYGIVVEIKNQIRHENAYYVRISDETMNAVLLRVHTGRDQIPGPRIELGNIIRVHRLTAQMEWDTGVSENTMVLSTAAHHNYVLFEQSNEQFQFYYNTCAKTVTLSDMDMRRVGELHMYKSKLDIPANEELSEPLSTEQSGIAQVAIHEPPEVEQVSERVRIQVMPQSSLNDSDGICGSDLASPCASDVSIGEDDTQSNSGLNLDESRIQAISNSRSDESFFSATSELDQPGDSGNRSQTRFRKPADTSLKLSTVQPSKNNSQSITFTFFRDLKMTNEPLNLLCQIVSLNEHREGTWCLILKDMEQTVPSDNFKQPQSSVANPSGLQLGVNIKNGIGLEKRDLLSMLHESQGTDEFYFIPNVTIKGIRPPYTLEIDGNSCEIRKYKHLMRFLEMDDTFSITSEPSSTANPQEGASSNTVPDNIIDEQFQIVDDMNSGGVVAIDSMSNSPSASDEDSDIIIIEEIPFSRERSSSPSDFVTASHTPSHSPVKIKIDRQESPKRGGTPAEAIHVNNQVIHDVPEESWTGRLRGRRKPRQHYQPEDTFQC